MTKRARRREPYPVVTRGALAGLAYTLPFN